MNCGKAQRNCTRPWSCQQDTNNFHVNEPGKASLTVWAVHVVQFDTRIDCRFAHFFLLSVIFSSGLVVLDCQQGVGDDASWLALGRPPGRGEGRHRLPYHSSSHGVKVMTVETFSYFFIWKLSEYTCRYCDTSTRCWYARHAHRPVHHTHAQHHTEESC